MNNAILIQTCFSADPKGEYGVWQGQYYDMLRLCYPRHSAYARAHSFDYWCLMSDIHPEYKTGAWPKVHLILDALKRGYEYIAYLDTDAVVWNLECDLRDALPAGAGVGAAKHDPAQSEYLRKLDVPAHYNVGALYVRNVPGAADFFADWLAGYPTTGRWQEQGVFNELIEGKYSGLFAGVDDTWNSTINVNELPRPNVRAWHGVMPPMARLNMMREALREDFIRFRV